MKKGIYMKENKKYKKLAAIFISIVIIYWCINNFEIVGNFISNIINVLLPFILGICLAFLLNIPMSFFEKKIFNNNKNKISRFISIIFAISVIVLILFGIVKLIFPELANIIKLLIDNIPYYNEKIKDIVAKLENIYPNLKNTINDVDLNLENLTNQIPKLITSSISIAGNLLGYISKMIIAFVFAIYILIDKEKIKKKCIKILYAFCSRKTAIKVRYVMMLTNLTFKKFITAQCLDSAILGILCLIGMLIFKVPYAVPISIFIGVTALIPIVGAFLGAAIGCILIASVNLRKVISFIIIFLVMQQIEGKLIYPKVVGNSIGLPGILVLFAVAVGGGLFGVAGMLFGVPTLSVIYKIFNKIIDKKSIKNKSNRRIHT
jgi:predicted PurR-regulated permease PerM